MPTAMQKGNALEEAVKAIETTILRSSTDMKGRDFKIESKKRIVVNGVPHEIDVYVEAEIAKGYRSIFIFECRNREKAVDKDQAVAFSRKISDANAQRGFLIGKHFTRGAKAVASNDARLELLVAAELPIEEIPAPFHFHCIFNDRTKMTANVEFMGRGVKAGKDTIPIELKNATLNGQETDLQQWANEWACELSDKNANKFASTFLPDGIYEREDEDERTFEHGQLLVNGHDIESVHLSIKFPIHVAHPAILSIFDVATRGRSYSLARVEFGNMAFVQTQIVLH